MAKIDDNKAIESHSNKGENKMEANTQIIRRSSDHAGHPDCPHCCGIYDPRGICFQCCTDEDRAYNKTINPDED